MHYKLSLHYKEKLSNKHIKKRKHDRFSRDSPWHTHKKRKTAQYHTCTRIKGFLQTMHAGIQISWFLCVCLKLTHSLTPTQTHQRIYKYSHLASAGSSNTVKPIYPGRKSVSGYMGLTNTLQFIHKLLQS
jgi:hypothetical protein